MSIDISGDQPRRKSGTAWGIVKRLLLGGVSALVQAIVLFSAAGRLDWVMGWARVGTYPTLSGCTHLAE